MQANLISEQSREIDELGLGSLLMAMQCNCSMICFFSKTEKASHFTVTVKSGKREFNIIHKEIHMLFLMMFHFEVV